MMPTPAQRRQRILAWGLYLTCGMARNLGAFMHYNGHAFRPRTVAKLNRAIELLDAIQMAVREELAEMKERHRG